MSITHSKNLSWGRTARFTQEVDLAFWRSDLPNLLASHSKQNLLAHGSGRSYGDSCLNEHGRLLDCSPLNRFIKFDRNQGLITCEAGITLADILRVIVPAGWFLPVVPGTKFITLGGAIANDIHGKNHHTQGTFGCHLRQFELWRRDRGPLICSPSENVELFSATIGGLGLTGFITWAEIQLIPIESASMNVEIFKYNNLDELFALSDDSDHQASYSMAWLDCLHSKDNLARGHFIMAHHSKRDEGGAPLQNYCRSIRKNLIPTFSPGFLLNSWTMRAFNHLYFHSTGPDGIRKQANMEQFFFPLDRVEYWNRLYGPKGFFQYQCVVPLDAKPVIKRMLSITAQRNHAPFLAVLKRFGRIKSPGLLSFPQPGFTLAMDFPNLSAATDKLFSHLDEEVLSAGGRIYPAKDSKMSERVFKSGYPNWETFLSYIDQNVSSSFWRRVVKT